MTLEQAYMRRKNALKYLQHCSRPYGSPEMKQLQDQRIKEARKAYYRADAEYNAIRSGQHG